jgi:hypothetical protein
MTLDQILHLNQILDSLAEHGKVSADENTIYMFSDQIRDWAKEEGVRLKFDYPNHNVSNNVGLRKARVYLRKVGG